MCAAKKTLVSKIWTPNILAQFGKGLGFGTFLKSGVGSQFSMADLGAGGRLLCDKYIMHSDYVRDMQASSCPAAARQLPATGRTGVRATGLAATPPVEAAR